MAIGFQGPELPQDSFKLLDTAAQSSDYQF